MILTLGEEHYYAWGELLRGIRGGEPAFNYVYGTDLFTYLGRAPAARTTFNEGMAEVTSLVSIALLASYDFSKFSKIVEVGGGYGSLIKAILNREILGSAGLRITKIVPTLSPYSLIEAVRF